MPVKLVSVQSMYISIIYLLSCHFAITSSVYLQKPSLLQHNLTIISFCHYLQLENNGRRRLFCTFVFVLLLFHLYFARNRFLAKGTPESERQLHIQQQWSQSNIKNTSIQSSYRSQQCARKGIRGLKESWLVESIQSAKGTLGGHFIDYLNVITHRQYGHYWLEHVTCLIIIKEPQSGPNFCLQRIDVKLKRLNGPTRNSSKTMESTSTSDDN